MAKLVFAAIGALLLSASAATAQPMSVPPTPAVAPLPPGVQTRTVSLSKIVAKVDNDARWATVQAGPLCFPSGRLAWGKSGGQLQTDALERAFRDEVEEAGFRMEGERDNLFEEAASFTEYTVAGVVKGAEGSFCFPSKLSAGGKVKGAAVLEVEWQIYSRLQRQVVARIRTRAGFESRRTIEGGVDMVVLDAFAETVKALVASEEFRKAFVGRAPTLEEAMKPPKQDKIVLGGPAAAPLDIADAVGSVVLILAGDGHGSGFLVSGDGYVMTDQHVVGSAKLVTVRWPDGIEAVGEVVRSDRLRDVALIKTDPRGRDPLPLRSATLRPGESVYAIGAPLEQRFQSTVTRGVVSAYRTIEGLRYLQSDVAISPGNSGGPLLDEHGAVVGMTKSTYRIENAPTGINFFTPTRDALDFLGAAQSGSPSPAKPASGSTGDQANQPASS
jgi:S1-C subfamily serine protease